MSDFEPTKLIGPTFCDTQPPEERAFILGYVLSKDVFLPEGFLDKAAVRGNVLDLGCGRGSLGAALREINGQINLVGVDIVTEYRGENFREIYSDIRKNNAAREVGEIKKKGQKFDLVVSCALPPGVIEDLINEGEVTDIVKPEGSILLIFDAPIGASFLRMAKEAGFELHNGTFPSDPDILYWHNGSKLRD